VEKLLLKYDLTKKIKEANEDFSLLTAMRDNVPTTAIYAGGVFSLYLALGYSMPEAVKYASMFTSGTFVALVLARVAAFRYAGDIKRAKAVLELLKLVVRLDYHDVNTSLGMLLLAEEESRAYHFVWEKPGILQEKYILLPSPGHKKDITLLQEHYLGEKNYYLSTARPTRVLKLKPKLA